MLISPYHKLRVFLLLIGDIAIAVISYKLSFFLRNYMHFFIFSDILPKEVYYNVTHYTYLLMIIQVMTLYFFGMYDIAENQKLKSYLQSLLFSVIICCLILIMFYYFLAEYNYPRSIFFVFGMVNFALLILFRYIIRKIFSISHRPKNVVILGTNKIAMDITQHLVKDKRKFNIKGFIAREDIKETHFMGFPILGDSEELLEIIKNEAIDEVIVAQSNSWLDDLIHNMSDSEHRSRITIVPSPYEILIGRLKQIKIHDIPLLEIYKDPVPSSSVFLKRVFDIFFSLFLLIITLPVTILVSIGIKLTSKGPVLYKQERCGKNKEKFIIYKFRTMIDDAEKNTGPVLASEEDNRITGIGRVIRKFRIDEIPQLINILRGDMSFVGPRPERPYFVKQFAKTIRSYNARFHVKPGLTGLAQINGEYYTDPEIKLKYDLAYICNQNIFFDFIILLETVKLVFTLHQR